MIRKGQQFQLLLSPLSSVVLHYLQTRWYVTNDQRTSMFLRQVTQTLLKTGGTPTVERLQSQIFFFKSVTTIKQKDHSDTLSWFRANQSLPLFLEFFVLSGKAVNTRFIVFDLTLTGSNYLPHSRQVPLTITPWSLDTNICFSFMKIKITEHSVVYSTFYFTHFFYVNFRGINLFRFDINILFHLFDKLIHPFLTNLRLFMP